MGAAARRRCGRLVGGRTVKQICELHAEGPYRAQTNGRVVSAVKYVRGNSMPTVRCTGDVDLNQQTQAWMDGLANVRSALAHLAP